MLEAFFAFLPLIYGKDFLRGLFMCEEKTYGFFNCISSVLVRSDICCVYQVIVFIRQVCDVILYADAQQALFIKQKSNESGVQASF